jgi:Flp pilus assembly protein TadG
MKSFVHKLRSDHGAEIAEAAVVLPLVFMFLLGIVWFGRAFNIYSTIQQAAQQGAIAAARPTCATCGNTTGVATVTPVVESVMKASNLDTTKIISNAPPSPVLCAAPYPAGTCSTAADNVTVCFNVKLNPPAATSPSICGTMVTFQYPMTFNVPFAPTTVNLTAQAQSRMEN